MDAKESWKILKTRLGDVVSETATENQEFFVFSVRPKNQPIGATSSICYGVNKRTGVIQPFKPWDLTVVIGEKLDATKFN